MALVLLVLLTPNKVPIVSIITIGCMNLVIRKSAPAKLTALVIFRKVPFKRKMIKMISDSKSSPVIDMFNDIDINDSVSTLLVLDRTKYNTAPKKKNGIIINNGIVPTFPSPPDVELSLHLLLTKHVDDPGGAIGRLEGQVVHIDWFDNEKVLAAQGRHAVDELLPLKLLCVPAEQGEQDDGDVWPIFGLYLPSLHCKHAADVLLPISGLKVPARQAVHSVLPFFGL